MPDHKRKKKRGRSKLFRSCFRSFASDEKPLLNDKSDGQNIKNGRLGKQILTAASGRCQQKDFVTDVTERPSHGRGVSRLLKTVLFDSVMAKKIRNTSKSSIASDTSEPVLSIENTGDGNACGGETTDVEDSSNLLSSSSRATSSSYSSSSSSSTNSTSRWPSEPKIDLLDTNNNNNNNQISSNSSSLYHNQKSSSQTDSISSSSYIKQTSQISQILQSEILSDSADSKNPADHNNIKSGHSNWNIRWCLFLLLSLIVLVTYGRIYSILCTSIWFYLMPLRRVTRVDSVSNSAEFVDTESEEYKKRVIMAGLLDRTRNPLR